MPSVSGRAPPESPVPAPRGTTLTFSASQKRRMRCHLLGGGRQDHGHGHGAVGGEPVALVGAQLLLGRDHAFAGHDRAQGRDDPVALGQDLGVGLGHLHGVAPW